MTFQNVDIVAYEVLSNRQKVASFRAPCVPQIVFGVEGVVDEMARKIGKMDPIDFRLKNACEDGHTTDLWRYLGADRLYRDPQASQGHATIIDTPVKPKAKAVVFPRASGSTGVVRPQRP